MRRSKAAFALIALLASACAAKAKPVELTVTPHCGPDGFPDRVSVGDKTIELKRDGDNLDAFKSALGGGKPVIHLVADTNVPYRCIGGIIFTLQRLGISKVGFIAEPPPAEDKP